MKRILGVLVVALVACRPSVPPKSADAEADGLPEFEPMQVPAEFVVEVPFTRQRGLVVIEAEVDGLERPLRLAIDSGAPTVIRSRSAAEMGTALGDTVEAGDAEGRNVQARPMVIPRMRIGQLTVGRVAAVSLALPVLDKFCPPLDGLLGVGIDVGSGFLDRVPTEIDPDKEIVRFADSGTKLRPGGYTAPLKRSLVDEQGEEYVVTQLLTQMFVADKELWVALDTGNNGDMDLPRSVFESLGYRVDGKSVVAQHGVSSFSAGGLSEESAWLARIERVRIGDHEMAALPVRVSSTEATGPEHTLLGQTFFRRFVLVIDFPASQVRYIPTAEPPSPDPKPTTGLGWETAGGSVRILALVEGSSAHKAGVEIGDEVIAVAGVPVSADDTSSQCKARKVEHETKGAVTYTLRRDGKDLELELKRGPLLPPL